jgi:GNAT superfamily N-acetyltransferase
LIIRKAKPEDLEGIVEFNIQMAKETEGIILDERIVREGVKSILDNMLIGLYLVAEKNKNDKMLCGQLLVIFEWSDWRNKNVWWIQNVYVDKKFRNKKVFSQLYRFTVEMAASEENVAGLKLYVKKNNNFVKRIYESLGLKKVQYDLYEISL